MSGTEGMLHCEEVIRLLAIYIDGELAGREHADIERHLALCRGCYSRLEFERQLKGRIAGLGRRELDPDVRARLKQIVSRFAAGPASQVE